MFRHVEGESQVMVVASLMEGELSCYGGDSLKKANDRYEVAIWRESGR